MTWSAKLSTPYRPNRRVANLRAIERGTCLLKIAMAQQRKVELGQTLWRRACRRGEGATSGTTHASVGEKPDTAAEIRSLRPDIKRALRRGNTLYDVGEALKAGSIQIGVRTSRSIYGERRTKCDRLPCTQPRRSCVPATSASRPRTSKNAGAYRRSASNEAPRATQLQ